MPCATIHMLTAGKVLGDWEDRPEGAPFPVHEAPLRRAFLLGAMGPDMGFVPGVDRLMSELAHYISTGRLARALLDEAESPRQRAFAWGWATHHITDVDIHPLVGRACGEHLLGDSSVRLNSSEDCETHVAMEVGLDMVFLATEPGIPRPASEPLESTREIAFLARALERTYGIRWDRRELRGAHHTATARTARWPRALGLLGRARGFTPGWEQDGPLRLLGDPLLSLAHSLAPSGTATAGFLRPLRPPEWLVDEVRNVAEGFARRFRVVVEDRMAGLEDRNLETGLLEFAPQDHPDSVKARRRLLELQEDSGVGYAPDARA